MLAAGAGLKALGAAARSAIGMAGVLLASVAAPAHAEVPYPSKPLRLIVSVPAGTSPDSVARVWGNGVARATGQPVVVENRPGASTIIAAQAVARSAADGHTLLWTVNNTFSINPFVYKKLPYQRDDFVPVTRILSLPYVLVTSAESPIRSLDDLVREARNRPGALTYASAGIGQGTHVALAKLLSQAGISMTHVPYKEYFMPDVIAQRVDVAFDASTTAIQQIKSGKLRALAVSSPRRMADLPDVPAIAERYPGFVGDSWYGIFAPRGTPEPALAALLAHSQRIVASPEFQAALVGTGMTPVNEPPQAFRKFLDEDARRWSEVVKANGITSD